MFEWSVSPEIFSLGPISIRWYSVMFILSFGLGSYLMAIFYKNDGRNPDDVEKLFYYTFIATIVGARLGHVLFYDPSYYFAKPWKILFVWEGGLASHGAAIGILTGIYLFSKSMKNQPYLWVLDRLTIVIALAGCFIRIGNFFNSEILGHQTDVAWAVIFTRIDDIPRHPVQLYEAFINLFIFLWMLYRYYRSDDKHHQGKIFGWFLTLLFIGRFIIEFFKEEQANYSMGGEFNIAHLLSLPFILVGLYFLLLHKTKSETNK